MAYKVKFTGQLKKDLKLAKKQGKDLDKLFNVIEILEKGEKLEKKYEDHMILNIIFNYFFRDFIIIYTKIVS